MKTQLLPSPDFKQFFKRAYAAWQGQKSVGTFGHHEFALVHVVDHVQFVAMRVGGFFFSQRVRNDADHPPACGFGGHGDRAHQAVAAAAIDQLTLAGTNPFTDGSGGLSEAAEAARA